MHVTRIGLAALKGTRHVARGTVELSSAGPVGDRVLCLVDPSTGRVLRTVHHRALLGVVVDWSGDRLAVRLPTPDGGATRAGSRVITGVPGSTGRRVTVDYWGRRAVVEVLDGAWAEAFSALLGRRVELARAAVPAEIVYGAPVSLVTTSSLALLGDRLGRPVDSAQFRATLTVDTGDRPAHVEDGWRGRRLRVGEAEVEVRAAIPRCAVVDLDPVTGARHSDVLGTLAGYRRAADEILFGMDGVVTRPGRVDVGAAVEGT